MNELYDLLNEVESLLSNPTHYAMREYYAMEGTARRQMLHERLKEALKPIYETEENELIEEYLRFAWNTDDSVVEDIRFYGNSINVDVLQRGKLLRLDYARDSLLDIANFLESRGIDDPEEVFEYIEGNRSIYDRSIYGDE